MSNKQETYAKVLHRGGGSFVCEQHEVQGYVDDAYDPQSYTVETIKMTREEFDALPDFEGF